MSGKHPGKSGNVQNQTVSTFRRETSLKIPSTTRVNIPSGSRFKQSVGKPVFTLNIPSTTGLNILLGNRFKHSVGKPA